MDLIMNQDFFPIRYFLSFNLIAQKPLPADTKYTVNLHEPIESFHSRKTGAALRLSPSEVPKNSRFHGFEDSNIH